MEKSLCRHTDQVLNASFCSLGIEVTEIEVEYREGEKEAVDPIQHTTVPGDEMRAVLNLGCALEKRFREVAKLSENSEEKGGEQDVPQRQLPE